MVAEAHDHAQAAPGVLRETSGTQASHESTQAHGAGCLVLALGHKIAQDMLIRNKKGLVLAFRSALQETLKTLELYV